MDKNVDLVVEFMNDEDWIDMCLTQGDPPEDLEKIWKEFQKWRKKQGE